MKETESNNKKDKKVNIKELKKEKKKNNKEEIKKDTDKKSLKIKVKELLNSDKMNTIVFAMMPIILVIFMIVLQNICLDIWFYLKIKVIAFTMVVFSLMYVILTLLTKNNKRATIIMAFVILIVNLISHLRFIYSGEVLTFSDFVYVNNIGQISTLMGENLISVILEILPIYLSSIVFISLLILLNTRYKTTIDIKVKKRLLTSLICLVPIIVIFLPIPGLKTLMLNVIYDKDKELDFKHNTLNAQYYAEYGLFGGMYWTYLESRIEPRSDYNPEELQAILDNVDTTKTENYGRPNIIVTFSESFYDITKISDDIKFDKDVTPNLHKLQEAGFGIETISPTYGGISANVEFELLTGFSCNYFGNGYSPFLQLFRTPKYAERSSILRELSKNGYKSKVVFGRDYFKSERVYKLLGIDEYEELDVKSAFKGYYTSDEYLTTNVINTLEAKPDDERIFHMTCTIESHMPFLEEKYEAEEYDIDIESSTLNDSMRGALKSYAQSCYDADEQLGRLYEYIMNYDEPTILIFFGDHLPFIPDPETQEDTMNYLQYFNTDDELLNLYRKYNTQGVIVANFDLGDTSKWNYLSADMILTNIINNMDIEISDYYEWLDTTSDILPASNRYVSCDAEGNLYWTEELKGEMKEVLNLRENMQYKVLIDGK